MKETNTRNLTCYDLPVERAIGMDTGQNRYVYRKKVFCDRKKNVSEMGWRS